MIYETRNDILSVIIKGEVFADT